MKHLLAFPAISLLALIARADANAVSNPIPTQPAATDSDPSAA